MERTKCAVCLSDKLSFIYSLKDLPFTFLPTTDPISSDTVITLHIYNCEVCGCAQLKHLLDPAILYGVPHNTTHETPTWKQHHKIFADFLCKSIPGPAKIVEIGGYSGVLANQVLQQRKDINYTIMDLCDTNPNIEQVEFINGNGETSNIDRDSAVVLSHVFEHLYEPHAFIENMNRNRIQNIFISIPNMKALLDKKNMAVISKEHTFYCGYEDILYIFSKGGYSCKSTELFIDHSLFFHFIKDTEITTETTIESYRRGYTVDMYSIYESNRKSISALTIEEPFFIVPAGLYGQLIYYFLDTSYRANILGFLDNDIHKIGKRLYGTPNSIFKMDKVAEYSTVTVLITTTPYTNEIIKQLTSYNNNIRFIQV